VGVNLADKESPSFRAFLLILICY